MKGFSALWVGALGKHWQLPPLQPAKTKLPHVRKTHNEAFVPESETVVRGRSDELPLGGIHYCFHAFVSAEFLVDVVKMITESLWQYIVTRYIITQATTERIPSCKWVCLGDYTTSRGASDMGLYPDLLPGHTPVSEGSEFREKWDAPFPRSQG